MPNISRANALGATSALILSPVLYARLAQAAAKADPADIKLLDAAIAAERAALKTYVDATAISVLTPSVLAVLKSFMADHQAHLDALTAAVTQSGSAVAPETAAAVATPALATEADVLALAYTTERLVASTYLDSIAKFKNRDFATTAASIMGVDATHVALLAEALKRNPAYPTSFITA